MVDTNGVPLVIRALCEELASAVGGTGQFILITRQSEGNAHLITNVEPRSIVFDVLRQMAAQEVN